MLPVLDEAAALPRLLADLAAWGVLDRALFVDNGSADGSPELVRAAGGRVVREPRRGYGFACLTGARAITGSGARVVVFMEADGTDDPADLERLVGPVLDGDVDLMVGSRRRALQQGGSMPAHQRVGNVLIATCLRSVFGLHLPDNGPFRAVDAALLACLDMDARAYAWTTEMVTKAAARGARVEWVEVAYRDRRGGSKIGGSVRGTAGAFAGIFGAMARVRLASWLFAAYRGRSGRSLVAKRFLSRGATGGLGSASPGDDPTRGYDPPARSRRRRAGPA